MLKLASMLENVKSVAIAGHIKPDGDCVGSSLAVYNYIREYYPQIEVDLLLDPIPNIFKFLQRADDIIHDSTSERKYDLFIVLDCGDMRRLGEREKYFKSAGKTLCVDHHISNAGFADETYIFPQASSTSELVFELLEKEKITKEIAECIYVGMVHDTGVFQYSNTSAKTMNIAGQLMEMGIDFSKIVDDTFYKKTYAQNRILGQALVDSKLYLDGKCIVTVVTKEEMETFQVEPKHLEGVVQQLRVTKGVEAAVFLYENAPNTFKLSMRSNALIDVASITMNFGGGGHVRAAGATMEGNIDSIVEQVIAEVAKQI